MRTFSFTTHAEHVGRWRRVFEAIDRPALLPLPKEPYEYAEWKKARVNIDYHVEADGHYYSVPHELARQEVDVRMTVTAVEIFHHGTRAASHMRSHLKGRHTTVTGHMPKKHQAHQGWTPERIVRRAEKYGGATAEVAVQIIESRQHPEQGYRPCLGLLRLGDQFSPERLEAACTRALAIEAPSYRSVKSILEKELDRQALPEPVEQRAAIEHPNIRGPEYFSNN